MKEKGKKKHFEGKALVMLIGETGKKEKIKIRKRKPGGIIILVSQICDRY